MLTKPFDQIEKADIDQLVASGVREGRSIEYKRTISLANDDEKKKVLASVSSFANAGGGDLLYGVAADDGVPIEARGISGTSKDQLELQLAGAIRNGIEPRIPGLRVQFIDGFEEGSVLHVRVPRSWNGPHMVTLGGLSKFYTRSGANKHQMDWGEIRSAFAASEELPEKINRFRMERLARIVAGETLPWKLGGSVRLVLHFMPVVSFSPEFQIDIGKATEPTVGLKPSFRSRGWSPLYNVDGVVAYDGPAQSQQQISLAYTQLFRSGRVEAVQSFDRRDPFRLSPASFENYILGNVNDKLSMLKALDVLFPIVVAVSILGVKGATPYVDEFMPFEHPVDRDELILPDVMLNDDGGDPNEYFRTTFNTLWNAFGLRHSNRYDDSGKIVKE